MYEITKIDCIAIGAVLVSLYNCGLYIDELSYLAPFELPLPVVIVIAAVFCIGLYFLQRYTTVGFWIMTAVMSMAWSLLIAALFYHFTDSLLQFWVLLIGLTIINIKLHLRARKYQDYV